MSQAQFDNSSPVDMYAEPERTSISAILSLVLGLLGCCGGLTSIFAILLGIFGIMKIKSSKGRVGGMGLAIAGLIIGLITLVIWIGLLIGASKAWGGFDSTVIQPNAMIFVEVQNDDLDAVRGAFSSNLSGVTDEQIIEFREAYRSSLGSFTSRPDGFVDYFKGLMSMGQQMQAYQGASNMIPMPFYFENGNGLVLVFVDPSANSNSLSVTKIVVIDQNGDEFILPPE